MEKKESMARLREARLVLKEIFNDPTAPTNIVLTAKSALDNLERGNVKAALLGLNEIKSDKDMAGNTRTRIYVTIMTLEKLVPELGQISREGFKPLQYHSSSAYSAQLKKQGQ